METTAPYLFNLYARELQNALANHHATFDTLKRDFKDIHPVLISRLRMSLDWEQEGKQNCPILPHKLLRMIIKHYKFSQEEIVRMSAAVFASSVCARLLNHVRVDNATSIAHSLFDLLVPMFLEGACDDHLSAFVMQEERGSPPMNDIELEALFTSVAACYDQATLALNMSYECGQDSAFAYQAHQIFREGLARLRALPSAIQQTEHGQFYSMSICEGDKEAIAILQASNEE